MFKPKDSASLVKKSLNTIFKVEKKEKKEITSQSKSKSNCNISSNIDNNESNKIKINQNVKKTKRNISKIKRVKIEESNLKKELLEGLKNAKKKQCKLKMNRDNK